MMESWRKVFRVVAQMFSDDGLEALMLALETDDPRLIQGATTSPPPIQAVIDWDCEGACLIGYAGWQGGCLTTVGQVEEQFARMCFDIDVASGEPAAVRWLLNWYDETPRAEMRQELLPEVQLEINRRKNLLSQMEAA